MKMIHKGYHKLEKDFDILRLIRMLRATKFAAFSQLTKSQKSLAVKLSEPVLSDHSSCDIAETDQIDIIPFEPDDPLPMKDFDFLHEILRSKLVTDQNLISVAKGQLEHKRASSITFQS